jgi:hypothetical protein
LRISDGLKKLVLIEAILYKKIRIIEEKIIQGDCFLTRLLADLARASQISFFLLEASPPLVALLLLF